MIEQQYYAYLKHIERIKKANNETVTATIEPSVLEKPVRELPGHDREVTSVAVSRDMKIVSGSEDKTVCIWSRNALAPLRKLDHPDAVRVVACAPSGADKNLCLAGCANGDIYLWDLDADTDEPILKKLAAHGDNAAISSLAFSPDGKYFASGGSDGSIRIWHADGTERFAFVPQNGVKECHEDAVTSLTFTPQSRLVSAGRDKTVRVWRLRERGAAPEGKAIQNREGGVGQLGVSQDGKYMLFDQVGGRTLKLLSVEKQKLEQTLTVPVNGTPFDTLAIFSPDSRTPEEIAAGAPHTPLILTGGAPEGRLQLWRAPDGETRGFEVRQFATRESMPVSCAAFSPDAGKGGVNSFAVSASGQKIYVWSIPDKQSISNHRIKGVPITMKTHSLDMNTRQSRVGFEIANPDGRFEAGRSATIVIESR
jgi:WD40 repeat protein